MTDMGKMFITTAPALPGKCVVCYTDAQGTRKFLDFGMSLDFYGAVLICEACVTNAAELFGFTPVLIDTDKELETEVLVGKLAETVQKVEALESVLRSYNFGSPANEFALPVADPDLPLEFTESKQSDEPKSEGKGDKSKPAK